MIVLMFTLLVLLGTLLLMALFSIKLLLKILFLITLLSTPSQQPDVHINSGTGFRLLRPG